MATEGRQFEARARSVEVGAGEFQNRKSVRGVCARPCVCVCVLKKPSQDISFLNLTNKPLRRQMRQTPI